MEVIKWLKFEIWYKALLVLKLLNLGLVQLWSESSWKSGRPTQIGAKRVNYAEYFNILKEYCKEVENSRNNSIFIVINY